MNMTEGGRVALTAIAERVEAGVSGVLGALKEKLAYDRALERRITDLHAELQKYRADLAARAVRPLALGMIGFHDDVGKRLDRLNEEAGSESGQRRALREVQEDVELVLSQNGITAFCVSGDRVSFKRQEVIRTIPTANKDEDGTIETRVRPGFESDGQILRREGVSVLRYDPTQAVKVDESPSLSDDSPAEPSEPEAARMVEEAAGESSEPKSRGGIGNTVERNRKEHSER